MIEGHTIYMGKDKFENEDLIRYGFMEDIWFHVDDLSSAHVYLRLPLQCSQSVILTGQGQTTVDSVSELCLEECAQLVKENSIEGSKKKSVSVCYTRWRNLKKTPSMEVGQVGFHHPERVRHYKVEEKNKDILKSLNKTKQEFHPDLEEERRQRELLYKAERKKQRLQLEAENRKAKLEYKQQKELRSYSSLLSRDNIAAGEKLEAAADLSTVNAYEEDFM
ncbi:Coiled-coil domain-containing protein 25 [Phytophthora citrophthora]|uniref:Coiled-coil domain-containing protein 25 n=1 Tax=Phytophthora citrophthora TaxID=4793 RepID=A0AAD9LK39_9STRA|nr:Coiled-coil domain-containing protein 25 [Phytophthora citrophthora]